MKKPFNYIIFAALALVFCQGIAHADGAMLGKATTAVKSPAASITSSPTAPTDTSDPASPQPVTVETSLDAIQAQFVLFVTRTQSTIDLLTAKDVDTTVAQADLDAATASLTLAKTNLSLLVTPVDTSSVTKDALIVTIKTNLIDARTHLIESLTALKDAVALALGNTQ